MAIAQQAPLAPRSASTRAAGLIGLALLAVALWLLIHPFRGIEHDSALYTLLAQARLHPQSLGHDLFVRYGTQNNFTIFSPIYAALIRIIGMERAAAVLTFLTHVGFFGCAWLLARRFMPSARALLAMGLLAVLPAYYGHGEVFAFTESFITPRQPAEAFVLAAIIAMLGSRQWLAAVWLTAAVLLHPIIAAPGVMLCLLLKFGMPRPRAAAMVVAGGTVALLFVAAVLPFGPLIHFDEQWLSVLQVRLAYLFPTRWGAATFGGVAAPIAVLIVGACAATDLRLRNLCLIAALTVLYGLAAGVLGGDLLHIAMASQLQTWRWLWLSMVLAIALSPVIAVNCWRAGPLLRAAAVLLLSAWLTSADSFSLLPAGLACICALLHRHLSVQQHTGTASLAIPNPIFIEVGAWAVAAVGIVILLGQVHSAISQLQALNPSHLLYDTRVRQAQILTFNGIVPTLLLVLATCAVETGVPRTSLAIGLLGLIACLAMVPYGIRTWTRIRYSDERYAAFEPWRRAIPPAAEVLWPDPPPDDWFVLGRASYWSLYQMAGMVFSRDVTMIGTQRESAVTPRLHLISTEQADSAGSGQPPGHAVAEVCKLFRLEFFASWNDLGPTPYPPLAPHAEQPRRVLHLYRCGGPAS